MRATRSAGPESQAMRVYALQQLRTLLRRLAYQINRTARSGSADSIHDLRVAIRRFQQCLRVFRQYVPKHEARRVRRKLKALMSLAAKVRDYDIALELIRAAGVGGSRSKLAPALGAGRKQGEKELRSSARRAGGDNFSRKWRSRLEL